MSGDSRAVGGAHADLSLGDVLRIFAGDFKPGRIAGVGSADVGTAIAALMVIPISWSSSH
jgi:hypothetical protein